MKSASIHRPVPLLAPLENMSGFFTAIRKAYEAAYDFERLNSQTDAALKRQGLTRQDLPRVLMQRHFE